ncbi:MAG TPA: hypothetical protein PLA85_12200 [Micropepsaceae bacterium]|nr:hypothetical protein [Micropepsaceae bacterium]
MMPFGLDPGWIWGAAGLLLAAALIFAGFSIRRSRNARFNKLDAAFNRARVTRQVNAGYKPLRK